MSLLQPTPRAIVIGASAGGVLAVRELLSGLPADFPCALLVVIHLPRGRPSQLAEVMDGAVALPVMEAEDKQPILPGQVLLAPPDYHLMVEDDGHVALSVDALATVAALGTVQARGYVGEGDVWRLAEGAKGRFFPDDGARAAFDITMRDIAPGGTATIDVEDLSSVHGGAIESHRQDDGRITPVTAQYRVVMDAAASDPAPEFRVRGIAIVAGQRQSFAARLWRQVVRVLVREGGI